MLAFLTDEDFNGHILRALRRQHPQLDIVRVQDVGLRQADDAAVLEWAARNNRAVLSHDGRTMPSHALSRVASHLAMTGLVIVRSHISVGRAVEEIVLVATCSTDGELHNRVIYIPLS
jgi:hypothetical protein